ncbi:RING-type E3 ubiquitin transferase [Sarracenia purpurea var. burkii]
MGRRKQLRPQRSVGIRQSHESHESELNEQNASENVERAETANAEKPFFVAVDRSSWDSNEHFDISEVLLTNLNLTGEFSGYELSERFYPDSEYYLRFRLLNANQFVGQMWGSYWPVLPASDICLEFMEKRTREDTVKDVVILSGNFDGTDEGVSGLVHLISLKFLTLRPLLGFTFLEEASSLRLRVEILTSAFDACESLLDISRQRWKKSMMSVMAWLRPEVMTSEARYQCSESTEMELDSLMEMDIDSLIPKKRSKFDATGFYEAIKPSKGDPMLENDLPDLLPELRPYQRRAAHWMVQREKGPSERSHLLSPLCIPVNLIDTCSTIFYNPFRYLKT